MSPTEPAGLQTRPTSGPTTPRTLHGNRNYLDARIDWVIGTLKGIQKTQALPRWKSPQQLYIEGVMACIPPSPSTLSLASTLTPEDPCTPRSSENRTDTSSILPYDHMSLKRKRKEAVIDPDNDETLFNLLMESNAPTLLDDMDACHDSPDPQIKDWRGVGTYEMKMPGEKRRLSPHPSNTCSKMAAKKRKNLRYEFE
ncbi:MAG: hypothetical protein Q9227_001670 [Pyrenula ochraceoflavens]